jgi:quaternary ammonium compound-resistance protein SugE
MVNSQLRDDPGFRLITRMPWIILFIAGLFEIAWAVGLKFTDGFTRFWPTLGTIVALFISVGLLGLAAKSLPLGTAYAAWTGIGAVGAVLCGIALFGETFTPARLAYLALIITGILGLKASS